MIEIPVPMIIKIGGFDYTVKIDTDSDKLLHSDDCMGQCKDRLREILVRSDLSPQQTTEVFIHEFIHAIDGIFCPEDIAEKEVHGLAQGLLQVMEQLGIRLVVKR